MRSSTRTKTIAILLLLGAATACRTGAPGAPAPCGSLTDSAPQAGAASPRAEPPTTPSGTVPESLEHGRLDDYIRHAIASNPGLEAARHEWLAEVEELPQAKSLPDPVLAARYYIEEVETRVGPQEWGLGVSQTFPWLGKRGLRGEQASARAEAARARYDGEVLATIEEVRAAWYELFYLERSILAVRSSEELLAHLEEVVRTLYSSGDANYADLIRAQVERDRQADRLRSLEDQRRPTAARLNRALHRAPDADVPTVDELPSTSPVRSSEDLRRGLEESSPVLRRLRNETLASRTGIELAELQRRPDLTFGVEYIETGSADPSSIPGSGDDPILASLSFNLPLWSKRNQAAEREARARHRAQTSRIESELDRLLTELETELYRARDARRQVELYQESLLPKAKQSLEATETAFRSGEADFLDLVDSEQLLLEFELSLARARTDRALAIARLERLVGAPVTDGIAPIAGDDR